MKLSSLTGKGVEFIKIVCGPSQAVLVVVLILKPEFDEQIILETLILKPECDEQIPTQQQWCSSNFCFSASCNISSLINASNYG